MYRAFNREGMQIAEGNSKRECINNGKLNNYEDSIIILSDKSTYIVSRKMNHRVQVKIYIVDNNTYVTVYYKGNSFRFFNDSMGIASLHFRSSIEFNTDCEDIFERLTRFANRVPEYLEGIANIWE